MKEKLGYSLHPIISSTLSAYQSVFCSKESNVFVSGKRKSSSPYRKNKHLPLPFTPFYRIYEFSLFYVVSLFMYRPRESPFHHLQGTERRHLSCFVLCSTLLSPKTLGQEQSGQNCPLTIVVVVVVLFCRQCELLLMISSSSQGG